MYPLRNPIGKDTSSPEWWSSKPDPDQTNTRPPTTSSLFSAFPRNFPQHVDNMDPSDRLACDPPSPLTSDTSSSMGPKTSQGGQQEIVPGATTSSTTSSSSHGTSPSLPTLPVPITGQDIQTLHHHLTSHLDAHISRLTASLASRIDELNMSVDNRVAHIVTTHISNQLHPALSPSPLSHIIQAGVAGHFTREWHATIAPAILETVNRAFDQYVPSLVSRSVYQALETVPREECMTRGGERYRGWGCANPELVDLVKAEAGRAVRAAMEPTSGSISGAGPNAVAPTWGYTNGGLDGNAAISPEMLGIICSEVETTTRYCLANMLPKFVNPAVEDAVENRMGRTLSATISSAVSHEAIRAVEKEVMLHQCTASLSTGQSDAIRAIAEAAIEDRISSEETEADCVLDNIQTKVREAIQGYTEDILRDELAREVALVGSKVESLLLETMGMFSSSDDTSSTDSHFDVDSDTWSQEDSSENKQEEDEIYETADEVDIRWSTEYIAPEASLQPLQEPHSESCVESAPQSLNAADCCTQTPSLVAAEGLFMAPCSATSSQGDLLQSNSHEMDDAESDRGKSSTPPMESSTRSRGSWSNIDLHRPSDGRLVVSVEHGVTEAMNTSVVSDDVHEARSIGVCEDTGPVRSSDGDGNAESRI